MASLSPYLTGIVVLLLFTSFAKTFTALNILGNGIGLGGAGFGVVFFALAMSLSLLVMAPLFDSAGGLTAFIQNESASSDSLEKSVRPFLEKNLHQDVRERMMRISNRISGKVDSKGKPVQPPAASAPAVEGATAPPPAVAGAAPFGVIAASFMLSQLKEALQIGFMILVPFLVIDLLVANSLMALGITQLRQHAVSLPLKLLLFISLDGWVLITEKLLGGYRW